ncbi:MAG: helicase-associated domain-containing protein [Egibacteraceae bacterium]
MPALVQDLPTLLRHRSPEELAALLHEVPVLAEAVQGRGPLASHRGSAYPGAAAGGPPSAERLAGLLGTELGVVACVCALDRTARQLVNLAVWHGGALTREQALGDVAASGTGVDSGTAARLDAAVARLDTLLLTEPDAGWLVLRAGVGEVAGPPGEPVRPALEAMASDSLPPLLLALGGRRPPGRKAERIDAIEALLRDGDTVRAVIDGLGKDARRLLDVLLAEGTKEVRDLGLSGYDRWSRDGTPLHELTRCGLVGVEYYGQRCWVWLDVQVALRGSFAAEWPVEPSPPPRPVRDAGGLSPVVGRLEALLAAWRAAPAPALADGGLGVRPVRAAAKQLGLAAGEVGLLATLAISLGLLDRVKTGTTGRGRGAKTTWVWSTTTLAADFAALPAERRWALLVQAWRDDEVLDEADGLPERLEPTRFLGVTAARSELLAVLASLPPGMGLADDDLVALAAHRCPALLDPPTTPNLVAAARALGLVPADGPVGLTALARALLDGPEALAAALPPPVTGFVVQADLSVVAPPDLAPDVAARLERYAVLESSAGARLYRLTEQRLAAALDTGADEEEILAFLDSHATAPLAQNVTYLVRDVARRHGRVRGGACASYLRCDDVALLARAVAVTAAKLRAVAPTVAVSSLPSEKVVAALRGKGLMPVAEDADGAVLRPEATPAPGPRDARLPALRPRLDADVADSRRLAAELLAAPPPAAPSLSSRPAGLAGPHVAEDRWPELQLVGDLKDWDDEDWDGCACDDCAVLDPVVLEAGAALLEQLLVRDPAKRRDA